MSDCPRCKGELQEGYEAQHSCTDFLLAEIAHYKETELRARQQAAWQFLLLEEMYMLFIAGDFNRCAELLVRFGEALTKSNEVLIMEDAAKEMTHNAKRNDPA